MLTLQRLFAAVFVAAVAALSLNAKGVSDMATLNDLVGQIENDALRERIEEEIKRVVKQKKFGLVFEEHLPECTPLWEIPVKRGSLVAKKDGKKAAIKAKFDGIVELVKDAIVLVAAATAPVRVEIPGDAELLVKSGDTVTAGDRLTTGSLNLQDLMKYKGIEATERYIMNDVLNVYSAQGHEI